jgi:hypothetical protein
MAYGLNGERRIEGMYSEKDLASSEGFISP